MKSLLLLAIVAALAVATLCYESHESMESYEISPFINRRNANTFMSPQQRWRAKAQERVRERTKPAYEINREACDDFKLCERYALMYGYNAAYNRYFRQRRGTKWDAGESLLFWSPKPGFISPLHSIIEIHRHIYDACFLHNLLSGSTPPSWPQSSKSWKCSVIRCVVLPNKLLV